MILSLIITVSISEETLSQLSELIKQKCAESRSDAVRKGVAILYKEKLGEKRE